MAGTYVGNQPTPAPFAIAQRCALPTFVRKATKPTWGMPGATWSYSSCIWVCSETCNTTRWCLNKSSKVLGTPYVSIYDWPANGIECGRAGLTIFKSGLVGFVSCTDASASSLSTSADCVAHFKSTSSFGYDR